MIAIVHTNDGHSRFLREPGCAGYAGIAGVVAACKDRFGADNVLLADCGDSLSGSSLGRIDRGASVVRIMNKLGYDVVCPGNADFAFGAPRLAELMEGAEFPFVCCNVRKEADASDVRGRSTSDLNLGVSAQSVSEPDVTNASDQGLSFAPFIMREVGGVPVAFVGMVTPSVVGAAAPVSFAGPGGLPTLDFAQDATGQAFYECVQQAIDDARDAGARFVVGLAHLGRTGQAVRWQVPEVVAHLRGLDALLDAHSHEVVNCQIPDADGNFVLWAQAGAYQSHVGVLLLNPETGELQERLIEADQCSVDESFQCYVEKEIVPLLAPVNQVVGETSVALRARAQDGVSWRIRTSETNFGDLVADAYLQATGADCVYLPSWSIRCDLAGELGDWVVSHEEGTAANREGSVTREGGVAASCEEGAAARGEGNAASDPRRPAAPRISLTRGDLWNALPVEMGLVRVKVSGRVLADLLEFALRLYPQNSAVFPQVAALRFAFDGSIPSPVQIDWREDFACISGPRRVRDILVAGEPLCLDREYVLGTVDLIGAHAGNGFAMLRGAEVQQVGCTNSEALEAYIAGLPGRCIGAAYGDPAGQGRIRRLP